MNKRRTTSWLIRKLLNSSDRNSSPGKAFTSLSSSEKVVAPSASANRIFRPRATRTPRRTAPPLPRFLTSVRTRNRSLPSFRFQSCKKKLWRISLDRFVEIAFLGSIAVHYLSSTLETLRLIFQMPEIGTGKIQTRDCWVKSLNATSVSCHLIYPEKIKLANNCFKWLHYWHSCITSKNSSFLFFSIFKLA